MVGGAHVRQRGEAPDVAPAEVGRDHRDALALLHHAVVDRDRGAVGEDALQRPRIPGRADGLADRLELLAQHRHGPADLLQDHVGAEHEDARVPEVAAVGQVARGGDHVRLLDEALHLVGRQLLLPAAADGQARPELQVAVAGLGPGGANADGGDGAGLGQLRRGGEGLPERLGPAADRDVRPPLAGRGVPPDGPEDAPAQDERPDVETRVPDRLLYVDHGAEAFESGDPAVQITTGSGLVAPTGM